LSFPARLLLDGSKNSVKLVVPRLILRKLMCLPRDPSLVSHPPRPTLSFQEKPFPVGSERSVKPVSRRKRKRSERSASSRQDPRALVSRRLAFRGRQLLA
jgi:hypothetical protein